MGSRIILLSLIINLGKLEKKKKGYYKLSLILGELRKNNLENIKLISAMNSTVIKMLSMEVLSNLLYLVMWLLRRKRRKKKKKVKRRNKKKLPQLKFNKVNKFSIRKNGLCSIIPLSYTLTTQREIKSS